MKSGITGWITLLFTLWSAACVAADNQLTSAEREQGWTLLFNGQDLNQWRNFKQASLNPGWQIDEGAIYLSAGGSGDILSQASYTNFELQLDWRIAEGGNSGVFILVDESGQYIYSHAPEIQILDNAKHSDNKIDSHRSGSLYDMVSAHPSSFKPAGEWNQLRIRLDDGFLQVWQNNVCTTAIVLGSSTWEKLVAASKFATWPGFAAKRSGHIGLQDHGDKVWFKNIKIRELN
jgi:hypothetical protein